MCRRYRYLLLGIKKHLVLLKRCLGYKSISINFYQYHYITEFWKKCVVFVPRTLNVDRMGQKKISETIYLINTRLITLKMKAGSEAIFRNRF